MLKNITAFAVALLSEPLTVTRIINQATLLEKGTYSSPLFTNLKQTLSFCQHFVNGVSKNSWDIVLFAH